MTTDRSERIRELCEAWRSAATRKEGAIRIDATMNEHHLWVNNLVPHEFTYDELRAAAVCLTSNVLFPHMNQVISDDLTLYWGWAAQIVVASDDGFFSDQEDEFRGLVRTVFRAALAGLRPLHDEAERDRLANAARQLEINEQELLGQRHVVLVHLAFPALEGVLKKVSSQFIALDGRILQPFSIGSLNYIPAQPGRRPTRCNRIGHQLSLVHRHIASASLRSDLDEVFRQISTVAGGGDAFESIDLWRNQSLHGERTERTIGGTLLSILSLVALDQLKERYDELRERAIERVKFELRTNSTLSDFPHWSFYAPVISTLR
jgi:hypothetical protein